MTDMSDTTTYIPGRHKPFDLSNITWANSLPPKQVRKPYEGQLKAFVEYVRLMDSSMWARYPFTYKTTGGATAGAINARKVYNEGLEWESRGTSLFCKVVPS